MFLLKLQEPLQAQVWFNSFQAYHIHPTTQHRVKTSHQGGQLSTPEDPTGKNSRAVELASHTVCICSGNVLFTLPHSVDQVFKRPWFAANSKGVGEKKPK